MITPSWLPYSIVFYVFKYIIKKVMFGEIIIMLVYMLQECIEPPIMAYF